MRTLWMALCALARLWPGTLAGCAEAGRCCPGRDAACFVRGWRLDRVYGTCFCDQACRLTGDCCFDYARACPARPCIVGEWSPWSGCADQCKPAARVRRRPVQQEPRNGGAPCPPLEERAGCLDYSTAPGQDCGHSFVTPPSSSSKDTCDYTQPAEKIWDHLPILSPCLYNYLCVQQGENKTSHLSTVVYRHRGHRILYGVQDRVTDSSLRYGEPPPDPMDAVSPRGVHSVRRLPAPSYELGEPSLFRRWPGLGWKSNSPLASNWQSSMSRNLEKSSASRSVFLSSCSQFYFYIDCDVNISECVCKHAKHYQVMFSAS